MFNSDEDDLDHVMIGEAAINLIFNREEISIVSLVDRLQSMAADEDDDERLLKIWEARKWLMAQQKNPLVTEQKQSWLPPQNRQHDACAKVSRICLHKPAAKREKE